MLGGSGDYSRRAATPIVADAAHGGLAAPPLRRRPCADTVRTRVHRQCARARIMGSSASARASRSAPTPASPVGRVYSRHAVPRERLLCQPPPRTPHLLAPSTPRVRRWAKRTFTTDFSLGALASVPLEGLTPVLQELANPAVVICLVAATAIAVVGFQVRHTVSTMHAREGHETRAEFEAGLLWKLSATFVANVVVMPVVVSCVQSALSQGSLVSQALYERTDFLLMATVIISIQRATADLPRALQAVTLCKRYALAWCAPAEELQALWEPPVMRVSLQMAQLLWLFACALLCKLAREPTTRPLLRTLPTHLKHDRFGQNRRTDEMRIPRARPLLADGPFAPYFYGLASAFAFFSFLCTKIGVIFCEHERPSASPWPCPSHPNHALQDVAHTLRLDSMMKAPMSTACSHTPGVCV